MSYYGYPNPGAYGANYQQAYAQYAAAATAAGGYDQFQAAAAYNAAAYKALQAPQIPPAVSGAAVATGTNQQQAGIASISQPAQRYDYAQQQQVQQQQQQQQNNKSNFYSNFQKAGQGNHNNNNNNSNLNNPDYPGHHKTDGNKWLGIKPNGGGGGGQSRRGGLGSQFGGGGNKFRGNRPNGGNAGGGGGGQPVPVFYCEVCKISCAGPQTYKEHTDGQKHKKREQASKLNEQVAAGLVVDKPNNGNRRNMNNANLNRAGVVIRCELCDVACTGRDAYTAHIRGMKHQKTLKLHQKLGKPIPPDVNLSQLAATTTSVPAPQPNSAPVISAPPKVNLNNFSSQQITAPQQNMPKAVLNPMPPSAATNTAANSNPAAVAAPTTATNDDGDYSNLEPIGKEYIETRLEGKILSFYCKLCDCQFNDPNAKDMHTKGRRHRLSYKKKVDPSLKVDMKGSGSASSQARSLKDKNDRKNKRLSLTPKLNQISGPVDMSSAEDGIRPLMGAAGAAAAAAAAAADASLKQSQTLEQLMSQPMKMGNNQLQGNRMQLLNQQRNPKSESFEDKHIIAKHNTIYPTQEEINAIQEIVTSIEKALKLVSDQIAEEDNKATGLENNVKAEFNSDQNTDPSNKQQPKEAARTLKGLMRVGLLAKGLLLRGDTDVKLILICSNKPTKRLLERVYKILLEKMEQASPDVKYNILLDKDAQAILVVKMMITEQLAPLITCKIVLTSPEVRTNAELIEAANAETKTPLVKTELEPEDLLDSKRCLESLAELRHAKWFQAVATQTPNCVLIIRILRDLCHRNPTWSPLTQWGLELLVERSLTSSTQQLSPGDALRRILECVSSGVLLPNGTGLRDPCEKEPTDLAENLKNQQREELTASAQMALRLLAFKQIYKILGMDKLEFVSNATNNRMPKKRQHTSEDNETNEKKGKKEDETSTGTATTAAAIVPTPMSQTQ